MNLELFLQILFWLAIAWIAYALVGYQLLLVVAGLFVRRPVQQASITPSISLLIAARNEEAVIADKLENTLALDYPREALQVIVMSDASTDRTDDDRAGVCRPGHPPPRGARWRPMGMASRTR